MDIFKVTSWESSKIGERNAEQLYNNSNLKNICKATNKLHFNKNKRKRKNKKKLQLDRSQSKQDDLGTTTKNKNSLKKIKRKDVSNLIADVGVLKKNGSKSNKVKRITKLSEEDRNTVFKQKKGKLKKQKRSIENKVILPKINEDIIETANGNNVANIQNRKTKLICLLKSPLVTTNKKAKNLSLKERMMERLKASRFRYINEQIYSSESKDIQKFFKNDPDAFYSYHEGYQQQISKWPLNPLDNIIKSIKRMPNDCVIADMGCGDARLAQSILQKVHSFDFVAVNEHVIACDMRHVPLQNESVDVVVFCLSLMGSNIREFLFEANRILPKGGLLKIAEVESRFDTVDVFVEGVKRFGFTHTWKDLSHKLFYFLDFKKTSSCKSLQKLPTISLHPCLYKKR